MKALTFAALLSAGVLAAQAPPPAKSAPAKTAPKAPAKTGVAAKAAPRPSASLMNPASLRAVAPPLYRVKFTTTHGDFVVEVHRDWAPIGADRFYNLVRNRFFNDSAFFRYVPGFIVQWGLPASAAVAKVWENANLKDDPVTKSNRKGTITFATAGPNTRTTQLFINLRDNAGLDGQGFAPFGEVTEGMDIVTGLYSGYGEQPDQDRLRTQGKPYLDRAFPKLDLIKSTTIIFPEAPAPAPKKAAPVTKKTGAAPAPSKSAPPPPAAKK